MKTNKDLRDEIFEKVCVIIVLAAICAILYFTL